NIGGNVSNQISPTKFYSNVGRNDSLINHELVVTTVFGCKDTSQFQRLVRANSISEITLTGNDTICAPVSIGSNVIGFNHDPRTNLSYQWLRNGLNWGSSTSAPNPINSLSFINPGQRDTIGLIVRSIFGCQDDTTYQIITAQPKPFAAFSLDTTLGCTPLIVTAKSPVNQSGMSHQWSIGNSGVLISGNLSASDSLRIRWANASTSMITDSIRLILTNGFGCRDTVVKTVQIYPIPQGQIISVDTLCAGGSFIARYNPVTQNPGDVQVWSVVGQGISAGFTPIHPDTIRVQLADVQGSVLQRVLIKIVVTTPGGCQDSMFKVVWVKPRPLISFASHSTEACAGSLISLRNDSVQVGAQYQWSAGLGRFLTINTPNASNTGVYFFDRQGSTDSTYSISLLMTDAQGCSDTETTNIVVHPRPQSL
ncbi:MAG: hypothetical protein ACOVOL_05565, partial [Bacteroidia bacterium]